MHLGKFIKQPESPLADDGSISCSVMKCKSLIMWKIFNVTSGKEYNVPGDREICINGISFESTLILPPGPVTLVAQCEEVKPLPSRKTMKYYSKYIVIQVEPPLIASG